MKIEDLVKLKVGDLIMFKLNQNDNGFIGRIKSINKCNNIENGRCNLSINKEARCIGSIKIIDCVECNNIDITRCGKENGWSLITKEEDFILEEEFMI